MKRVLLLLLLVSLPLFAQNREVSAGIEYEEFQFDEWVQTHVALKWGPVIGRISQADRGDLDDRQFEVEAYPKLGPKRYAYLAAAASSESVLYPDWRAGAELYQGFGNAFEGSLGYRRLEFDDSVDLFTASLGKYAGNWLIQGRVYHADDDLSWQGLARRYVGDHGSYVGLRAGLARDDIRSGADVIALDSPEVAAEARWVWPQWTVTGRAGVARLGEDEGFTGAVAVGRRF